MAVDFEKGKSYKLSGDLQVMDKGEWLPEGAELEILRNDVEFDNTLLVRLPSGKMATIASAFVAALPPVAPDKVDFADFTALVLPPKTKQPVMLNGIEHQEFDVPILFKTGNYPDKNFAMTVPEAEASLKDFNDNLKEAPAPISHKPTIFDKHNTAKLTSLDLKKSADGSSATFSAKALLPTWLGNFLSKDGEWGISPRWTNVVGQVKRLVHAAFVPNPRIESAKIVADDGSLCPSFAAEFERVIPTMNGVAMGGGTQPGQTEKTGEDLPATPPDVGNAPSSPNAALNNPADQTQDPDDDAGDLGEYDEDEEGDDDVLEGDELFQALSDIVSKALEGAKNGGDPKFVAKLEQVQAALAGGNSEAAPAPAASPPPAPAMAKPERQSNDVLPNGDFSKDELENFEIRANHETEMATVRKQLSPGEAVVWKAAMIQCLKDDKRSGTADFSNGESRWSTKVKELQGKEINPIFVGSGEFRVLKGEMTPGQVDFEKERTELDQLLAMTETGRRALEMRVQNK